MKIVLVDDDSTVRDNLRTLLSMYVKEAEVIAEADGVQAGLKCLSENTPDLLLLDVEMKDGTGYWRIMADLNPSVVHQEYREEFINLERLRKRSPGTESAGQPNEALRRDQVVIPARHGNDTNPGEFGA